MTNVTIPGSVTNIGAYVFSYCSGLTGVTIPGSVIHIGLAPFASCKSLAAILVDTNNPAYVGLEGVLFDKNRTILIQYPGAKAGGYTIPDGVTDIGDLSFYSCARLTSVTIPDSVTLIRSYAFSSCRGLTNVTMGNHVSDIGYHAFAICISLPSVTIPNTVTNIGQTTFQNCSSLTSVTIPASVAKIGDESFSFCSRLAAIIVDTNNPAYLSLDGVMFSKDQTTLIQYPGGRAGSYTVPNSVTNLGNGAFDACVGLTGVYFQGNAPGLGWSVFYADELATVYYLPGTTGWGPQFGELSTALWTPQVQTSDNRFGVRTNQFGFDIAWASGMTVVVEASTSLANPAWYPLHTNTLTGPSTYFSDPQWTNYPGRFYRLHWE